MEILASNGSATLKEKKDLWSREEKRNFKNQIDKRRKCILVVSLLLNFGVLFVLKYFNFLAGGLLHVLFGYPKEAQIISILLPLGISFYTFQATGYLIDVYRQTASAEKNLFKFALFVSFFPQIVQGPINSFEKLSPQFFDGHALKWVFFKEGGILLLWGFFKKLVVADYMFSSINKVSSDYNSFPGQLILLAALMYALQLYADFSGGIDIARGVAKLFGIDLEHNFRQPYFSQSISEYWRRWHITLGLWMKQYVFYSLAMSTAFLNIGRRISKSSIGSTPAGKHLSKSLPSSLATLIVFLLIGIWHGANSRYIGFGLWNGLVIMISALLAPVFPIITNKLHINTKAKLWNLFCIIRTFIIVLIGYYFDIAPNILGAFRMMKLSIIDCNLPITLSQLHSIGINLSDCLVIIYGLIIIFLFDVCLENTGLNTPSELLAKKPAWIQWFVILILVLSIITFGVYGSGAEGTDFVYMGF